MHKPGIYKTAYALILNKIVCSRLSTDAELTASYFSHLEKNIIGLYHLELYLFPPKKLQDVLLFGNCQTSQGVTKLPSVH